MKALSYLFSLVLLAALASCGNLVQDVAVDNIPSAKFRLVVQSFISPQDTAVAVYVDQPTSILGLYTNNDNFGNRRFPVQNATVDLSDGTKTIRLTKRNQPASPTAISLELYYAISAREFPVVAGRTYTLTVSAPGFPTVSAQCTVPSTVPATAIRVDSTVERQFEGSSTRYFGRITWRDQPGATNYYWLTGNLSTSLLRPLFQGSTRRDSLFNEVYRLFPRDAASPLLTDQNRDGQELTSPVMESFSNFYTGPNASGQLVRLNFSLSIANCEPNFYRFMEAVNRQTNQGDNPFAEPVLIPSNIEGGLGCFGAYNRATLSVQVR